jgi:hypothetical protein
MRVIFAIYSIISKFPEAKVPLYFGYTRGLADTNFIEMRATLRVVR